MNDIIDRVADALMKDMFAEHELPLDPELHEKYRGLAQVAIRALRNEIDRSDAMAGLEGMGFKIVRGDR
jgi:hypothetical protein